MEVARPVTHDQGVYSSLPTSKKVRIIEEAERISYARTSECVKHLSPTTFMVFTNFGLGMYAAWMYCTVTTSTTWVQVHLSTY